jgi:hypothetical protein
MALVCEQTLPTERPPLDGGVSANFCGWRVSRDQRNEFPRSLISVFLDRSRYFFLQVAPQLSAFG